MPKPDYIVHVLDNGVLTSRGRQDGTAHPMISVEARKWDFCVDCPIPPHQSTGTSIQTLLAHEHASVG